MLVVKQNFAFTQKQYKEKFLKENRNDKRSVKSSKIHSRKLSVTFVHYDQRCKREFNIRLRILILPYARNNNSLRV